MKNLLTVLVMGMFFAVLAAGITLAAEACPAGQSCSENFSMPVAQTGPVAKAPAKKEVSAEDAAAFQKAVATARQRDNDKTVVFTKTSNTDTCYFWELENKIDEMLIKSPDVIVDRKEYLSPAYVIEKISQSGGRVFSKCTAAIVVHYHKIKGGDEKK